MRTGEALSFVFQFVVIQTGQFAVTKQHVELFV